MILRVTIRHIERGVAHDNCLCPIGLAMTEAGFRGVYVGSERVQWSGGEAPLPLEAQRFVEAFDHGNLVGPMVLQLAI